MRTQIFSIKFFISLILLPDCIINNKAVKKPQNSNQQCFKWAILANHVTGENRYRVGENYYIYEDKFNFTGLKFLTPVSNIKIFKKNNKKYICKCLRMKKIQLTSKSFLYNVFPLKVSKEEKSDNFDL